MRFAAVDVFDFELVTFLKQKYQIEHVSNERIVSGPGIVDLAEFWA